MPRIHKEEMFRKEIYRLIKLGVLQEVRESEWGASTFIIPKKKNTMRFISDFRKLNTMIKRKPYPIPVIGEILSQLEGFKYATTLDLNMEYYTLRLSTEASKMCTIVTEFGKFEYLRLPMGVKCSPDIFQSKINEMLGDIDAVRAYLDDVLVLAKGNFKDHLTQVQEVLKRLQKAGLKVNADKSSFGVHEFEYLGYIINREGIKPDPKKIEAIMKLERPTINTEVRCLVGMVQFYRDMWKRCSHILAPFTDLASGPKQKKIKWTPDLEKAFQDIKKAIATDKLLHYPDW